MIINLLYIVNDTALRLVLIKRLTKQITGITTIDGIKPILLPSTFRSQSQGCKDLDRNPSLDKSCILVEEHYRKKTI